MARLVLERRGPRASPQCSADDRLGDVHMAVSLVTTRPGRPASCVSVTDGERREWSVTIVISFDAALECQVKGERQGGFCRVKNNASSVAHGHHPSWWKMFSEKQTRRVPE